MTEHSAVIFVFFFLAEYGSIVLICILNSILFLAGYIFDFSFLYFYVYLIQTIGSDNNIYLTDYAANFDVRHFDDYLLIIATTMGGVILGVKTCMMIFTFI